MTGKQHDMGFFERYLTLWIGLCIGTGILLGAYVPPFAKTLDSISINVNGASIVSIPIAVCLFFMMYPIMVKIDFPKLSKLEKTSSP
jgi:ACR3 family arsenite transporter